MTPPPNERNLEKARELVGDCTCGFIKGFSWDGKHEANCIIKRIATALTQVEAETRADERERCVEAAKASKTNWTLEEFQQYSTVYNAIVSAIRSKGQTP